MSSTLIYVSVLLISVYVSAESEASVHDFTVKTSRAGNFYDMTIDIDIKSTPNHHFEAMLYINLDIHPILAPRRVVLTADSNGRINYSVGANTKDIEISPSKEYEIAVRLYFTTGDPSVKRKTISFN